MNVLHIMTENGYMDLNIDEFFPCNMKSFRKVFKIIRSCWKNDIIEIIETLNVNFQSRLTEEKSLKDFYGKKYVESMQKKADLARMIKEKKRPDGSTPNKDELEVLREEKRRASISAQVDLQYHNKHKTAVQCLEVNLKLLDGQRCQHG